MITFALSSEIGRNQVRNVVRTSKKTVKVKVIVMEVYKKIRLKWDREDPKEKEYLISRDNGKIWEPISMEEVIRLMNTESVYWE